MRRHFICTHWFDTILIDLAIKSTKIKQTNGVLCIEFDDRNQQDTIYEHVESLLFCQPDICPKAHAETYPQGGSVSPTTQVSASLTLFNSLILHRHEGAKTHSVPIGSFCKHYKNLISDHWVISC